MTATPTRDLPYEMIDALGFFTIFNSEADAAAVANGINAQNVTDNVPDCEAIVSVREDGKFLVTMIELVDELCWHAPATLLRKAA